MIGSIRGKIILKTEKFLIVENGGVGYKLYTPTSVLADIKKTDTEIFFWTHTHVREDALDLYGFLDPEELGFFEMLINVSGIGPRSALAILGIASIDTLKQAIGTGDTSYLTKISGIGRKTAEKIVIELRDKMSGENTESLGAELDSMEALKSLGYGQNEIREALKKVRGELDTNKKIKEALKILGGK